MTTPPAYPPVRTSPNSGPSLELQEAPAAPPAPVLKAADIGQKALRQSGDAILQTPASVDKVKAPTDPALTEICNFIRQKIKLRSPGQAIEIRTTEHNPPWLWKDVRAAIESMQRAGEIHSFALGDTSSSWYLLKIGTQDTHRGSLGNLTWHTSPDLQDQIAQKVATITISPNTSRNPPWRIQDVERAVLLENQLMIILQVKRN